jgi:mannose-6-phosphate isomerase-like protein (cupin superfamily)
VAGPRLAPMRAGDAVWNPLTGEKALLVEGPNENGGTRIISDFGVERGGFVPGGEHVHDHCSEHFEVKAGQITFVVDGEERTLRAGEEATVPPGSWHHWWNSGQEEVVIRTRVEPALELGEAILVIWGLCADGHTNAEGRPSPLLGALLLTRYRREIRYRQPPDVVQRLLFPPLAALARRRGLEATIEKYLDITTHPSAAVGLGRLPTEIMAPRL